MTTTRPPAGPRERSALISSAWVLTLLVSDLPDILCHTVLRQVPDGMPWLKIGFLGAFLALGSIWSRIRLLRHYALVMLVLFLSLRGSAWVGEAAWWRGHFGGAQVSFTVGYLGIYLRDLGVAAAVIVALWAMKRRRREFFLTKGRLDAPIEPVPWLGIRRGESWRTFGWIFAGVASLAVLVPVMMAVRPTTEALGRSVPLLPSVLLFAAVNAFTEEVYFRCSVLSTLHRVVGRSHALWMAAAFFGLAHYLYGSPPGIVGAAMTGFLALLLGKSLLETGGLFWAWFIHLWPDVVIFVSYAIERSRG